MAKVFIFSLLWWITGSPFLALLILIVVLYALDRKYVGLLPNVFKPLQVSRRIERLKQQLKLSPHDTSAKTELARGLIQKKRYDQAMAYLQQVLPIMEQSPEVHFELGLCHLKLGQIQQGEELILNALRLNERVRYGEPYIRLAEAFTHSDADKALHYLHKFREIQSSSCEGYYRLGGLYEQLGRSIEAGQAYRECIHIYRVLPKYKKRSERRWFLLSLLKRH